MWASARPTATGRPRPPAGSASATGVIVNGNFPSPAPQHAGQRQPRRHPRRSLGRNARALRTALVLLLRSAITSASVLYGGEYTITTLQPRYLNATSDLLKKIIVKGPYLMSALTLKGGNAYWKSL